VNAKPDAIAWREALATALEISGDPDIAQRILAEGIARNPAIVALHNATMLICMRQRDFSGAITIAEEARRLGIADACTFGMKGHALASLGDHEGAAAAYQEALKLGPDDPYVRHLVMASGVLPSATRAPPEYLATVFDGYADRFEPHLVSLGYTVPVSIRERMLTHPAIAAGEPIGPALDLGCGTGLVALSLSDLPIGPLTGIDLSGRMLERAKAKQLYAELRQGDILTELEKQPSEPWSLIIAADVLIYFGALDAVFTAIREQLAPGGWFVFSLEELTGSDASWQLHRHGRYAHRPDYVRQALQAVGLNVLSADAIAVRHEAGMPVPGLLIVAERPRHQG
jgi:predicted TPR repeat methyltransferase